MNENYTKGVRKVLTFAKEEAIKLGQTYIGSEHVMLGILKDSNGTAASTLKIIGCNLDKIKESIESLVKTSDPAAITPPVNEKPITILSLLETVNPESNAAPPDADIKVIPDILNWNPPISKGEL